jgi:predicted nucleic acid-binding protein
VPLIVAEPMTLPMRALVQSDPDLLVWWGTPVECVSALSRREREGALDSRAVAGATNELKRLADRWHEVEPTEIVREIAARLLRVHQLRAAGALQLAAALVAAEHRPASLETVTLDARLADAMRREGFALVEIAPLDPP